MRTGTRRTWTLSSVLLIVLSCVVFSGPAAHAVFTSSTAGAFTASAYALTSPAGNVINATCTPIGNSGKHRLAITVVSRGSVPKANAYVLIATGPTGQRYTVDLATSSGLSLDSATGGRWTYSVESQYRVPGTTNAWTSAAVNPASINC